MNKARRFGFTLIELLVVISIIAILVGLLSSGLSGAISAGKTTKEMNRLRQLMLAWTMYSGQYNDRLLPGFLESGVQQGAQGSAAWQVRYKNKHGTELDPLLCQTYPWRLASYMDFSIDPIMGYRADSEENLDYSSYLAPEIPDNLPASLTGAIPLQGSGAALQPAFGYNAYYLGGWWEMVSGVPTMKFGNDGYTQAGTTGIARGRVVAQTIGNIPKPSELIVFSASIFLNQSDTPYSKLNEYLPGSAWVVPHKLGQEEVWGFGGVILEGIDVSSNANSDSINPMSAFLSPSPLMQSGDIGKLMVFKNQSVPFNRYGKMVSVGVADGSTKTYSMTALNDIRLWVPVADTLTFSHAP